jgi:uncharacterized protein
MKIKLDENLSGRLIDAIEMLGHDVDTVVDEGLISEPDEAILVAAASEGRMLFTLDMDFADERFLSTFDHFGVVVFRSAITSIDIIERLIVWFLDHHNLSASSGHLTIVSSGNVRVRYIREAVRPLYVPTDDPQWLAAAEDLLSIVRNAKGRTRGEIEAEIAELVGDTPATLIQQGLAKLLDDRCDYETIADRPPEFVREVAFRHSAIERAKAHAARREFDRDAVLQATAAEIAIDPSAIDGLLFADLKDEQRNAAFEDIAPERLLQRYNVALAQSVLLRSVGVSVRVFGLSPARLRQLFRILRFRRLIASIRQEERNAYFIRIDGPLSLFSATQKYGLQLALFLPALLHCPSFELDAELRWGAERKDKTFRLTPEDGLRSHTADYGVFTPKEFELFAASFRTTISDWLLSDDPPPIALPDGIWVPDFTLTHTATGQAVHLEIFGYWRRVNLAAHAKRLQAHLPRRTIVAVSGQYQTDEDSDEAALPGVVYYKRTPSAEAIANSARMLLD